MDDQKETSKRYFTEIPSSQSIPILPFPTSGTITEGNFGNLRASVRSVQYSIEGLRKQKRTWDLQQCEKLQFFTRKYCEDHSKIIELLTMDDYSVISRNFDKTPEQCMTKMLEIVSSGSTSPGVWGQAEDELLMKSMNEHMGWKEISEYINSVIHAGMKVRTPKHCKERWNNHLNPCINKGHWTFVEDLMLLEAFLLHKNKWSFIAKQMATRNENHVKNRLNSLIKRERRISQIDDKEQLAQIMINKLKIKINQQ